jgi:toxin ParE1/3/4
VPELYLTPKAESDLDAINEHYTSVLGAAKGVEAVLSIIESLNMLKTFPHMGRAGRLADTRELVLSKYPFLAAYRVEGDALWVFRIVHQHTEYAGDW